MVDPWEEYDIVNWKNRYLIVLLILVAIRYILFALHIFNKNQVEGKSSLCAMCLKYTITI